MTTPFLEALGREFARSGTRWCLFDSAPEAEAWAHAIAEREEKLFGGQWSPPWRAVAVTWATALIAETGSLVLTREDGPRGDALLTRHHVALVHARDVHRDLESFCSTLPGERLHEERGGHLTLVTGPSRTADIEKVLVTPALGPTEVSIGIVAPEPR